MRAAVIAFVLAVSATTARADDDPLATAIQLEAQLDYEGALAVVERVIAQGGADHDRLVTLHLFAGRLAAGLERTAVAEDHFARVLALDPTQRFAEGTSPKITGPFERARSRSKPLRITAEIKPDAITIVPETDPLGLAAGIAVRLAGSERELRDLQKRRMAIPTGARAIEVSALDPFGNRVWSQTVEMTSGPVDMRVATLRPLYARWPFWATATLITAGAGGLCAWRFSVAQDEWDALKAGGQADYSELKAVEDRGKRWGLAANISFGAAAVSALATLYTAARGSTTTAVVTAQPDAVGLAVVGSF